MAPPIVPATMVHGASSGFATASGGRAAHAFGRSKAISEPCVWFDPDRVLMLTSPPAARPNSAEKPLDTVCISSTDSGVLITRRICLLPAREVLSRPSDVQVLRLVPPNSI